jgi:hypothetical protein
MLTLYKALFPHMLVTQTIECDKHFGMFCLIILSRLTKKNVDRGLQIPLLGCPIYVFMGKR